MKVIALWDNYNNEGQSPVAAQDYGPLHIPASVWLSDSCLLRERRPFYIPEFDDDFRLFPTVVLRMSRLGKSIPARFASRYWHEASIWINVRAAGMLAALQARQAPIAAAVAFDNSLVSAPFFPLTDEELRSLTFTLWRNDMPQLTWHGSALRLGAAEMIEAISRNTILKTGDILMTGFDPQGVKINKGDTIKLTRHIDGAEEHQIITEFSIK